MMNRISCVVVDDEPIARDILKSYIERLPQLILSGDCKNAGEAFQVFRSQPVDVVFLDIRMPVITGTDFLRSLPNPPWIVFTTAYAEYAVEGFELNSVDYLLKPVTFERFCQAIQKVQERLESQSKLPVYDHVPSYIFIKQDSKLLKVDLADVSYVQAERDYCFVYLSGGRRILASMHLKLFEQSLPPRDFIRTHRSYIVNLSKIKTIKGNSIGIDHTEIPIGGIYRDQLFNALHIR